VERSLQGSRRRNAVPPPTIKEVHESGTRRGLMKVNPRGKASNSWAEVVFGEIQVSQRAKTCYVVWIYINIDQMWVKHQIYVLSVFPETTCDRDNISPIPRETYWCVSNIWSIFIVLHLRVLREHSVWGNMAWDFTSNWVNICKRLSSRDTHWTI